MDVRTAQQIMEKYNEEAFHRQHARAVSATMGYFAQKHDPDQVEYWRAVGMLHDVDFEQYPDQHCVKGEALLQAEGVPQDMIRAAMSHGFGLTGTPYEPEHVMEKVLFAVDELTGLIGAAALMRPSKSTLDMELSSVKKKFKDKKFAAGCSRDVIAQGADMLGWPLETLLAETLEAMKEHEKNEERI